MTKGKKQCQNNLYTSQKYNIKGTNYVIEENDDNNTELDNTDTQHTHDYQK